MQSEGIKILMLGSPFSRRRKASVPLSLVFSLNSESGRAMIVEI
jgi:hypothetical protein